MEKYKIMIVDDEYSDRMNEYNSFFSEEFSDVSVIFDIISVEYGRDFQGILKNNIKEIDAFFLDASLIDESKGWGGEFGQNFNTILFTIRESYEDNYVPPIFLVSKHWQDTGFLSTISKAFAIFHNPLQPSRFYDMKTLDDCILAAERRDSDGKLGVSMLKGERSYIKDTILQYRNEKYNSSEPIDAVIMIAVPDERTNIYKYFGLNNSNDKRLKQFGFSYQQIQKDKKNIIIVAQTTMGMTDAARTATAAILAFHPKMLFMTGICAGRRDKTRLGDIIIAKDVFDYSLAKINNDCIENRPSHKIIKSYLEEFVGNNFVTHSDKIYADIADKFLGDVPDYKNHIHLAPMASGPWVVNNKNVFEKISEHISSACIAIDMEAYAVALAAEQLETPWLVMKCVQDFADGEKDENEIHSRTYASYCSTYLLCENISKIIELNE